jgi:uncharacterized protein YukE
MFGKKDAKLGQAMSELRDALSQITLKELKIQSLERALYQANEQIEEEQKLQDHRACYARIEELEVELQDLRALRVGWDGTSTAEERERERAEKAEATAQKMREAIEYALELLRELQQEVAPTAPGWNTNGRQPLEEASHDNDPGYA